MIFLKKIQLIDRGKQKYRDSGHGGSITWLMNFSLTNKMVRCSLQGEEVEGKGRREFCVGFPLLQAFEFFMLQAVNVCHSGPDLVLISVRLHTKTYG